MMTPIHQVPLELPHIPVLRLCRQTRKLEGVRARDGFDKERVLEGRG